MKDKDNNDDFNTTVVTLDDFSFDWLMDNLEYAFPGSPDERKLWDYVAFYRTSPVSAITHYGKIEEVIEDAEVDGKYKLMNFGYRAPEKSTKVLFEDITELEKPVKAEGSKAIQGTYYTKLEYIKKAETIPELWDMKK